MALMPDAAVAAASRPDGGGEQQIQAPGLQGFVFALFFIFGGITSLNDVIIPKLKELFTLSYTEAMLIQSCFFFAYAAMGIPAAWLVKKIGYMRGAVVGLLTMTAGCLLFIPASQVAVYALFLFALFVLGCGIVIVQVVVNPLILLLGKPETAHGRLTFAQAFNSLGTTVFPLAGAALILGSLATVEAADLTGPALAAYRQAESAMIVKAYLGIAAALVIVALAVWTFRNRLQGERHEEGNILAGFALLRRPRFAYGASCIFLYVGAEVAIGSMIINYLALGSVLGQPESVVGWMIALYWGGAMLGRFIGSMLMYLRIDPTLLLLSAATGAIALILLSANSTGNLAAYSLLAVGLMNSIMFPTIFSLASKGLGHRTADGSGIINVAIVGGAVVPLLVGLLADLSGSLTFALAVPVVCYAIIGGFGLFVRRAPDDAVAEGVPGSGPLHSTVEV